MSSTEIYGFNKKGDAYLCGEVRNAFRGAMAIWGILEERYLPMHRPSYVPEWIATDEEVIKFCHYKPSRCADILNRDAMEEIWDLYKKENVSDIDKIVLGTTFDDVIVKKEDVQKVIDAFNGFEGETSLKEQAAILEEILKDEEYIAVAWNQTSVNGGAWERYDEEEEEYEPYNIFKGKEHWNLFKEESINE